jgi:hypothetical protein
VAGDVCYIRVEVFVANIWGVDELKTGVSETCKISIIMFKIVG